jgi:hypothetical protein
VDLSATAGVVGGFTDTDLHRVVSFASLVEENIMGRGILLWLLGVPIPIIILLALFFH